MACTRTLASDHYHYWEEGGGTYHTRYNTWEIARGKEGEPWKGDLRPVEIPETPDGRAGAWVRQDWVNRKYMSREEDQPQPNTFKMGLEFMRTNAGEDNWFLQIETFDPHEPFFTQQRYKDLYPHEYHGRHFDWPNYRRVAGNAGRGAALPLRVRRVGEHVRHLPGQSARRDG